LATLIVLIVLFDPVLRRWHKARTQVITLNLTSSKHVKPASGLVLLISRGDGVRSGMYAIDHHGDSLTHVWLLHSSNQESIEGADQVEAHCRERAPKAQVEKRLVADMFSIEMSKALVETLRNEAHRAGLKDHEFICDFTGMTKPVSAGVVLACVRPEHRLQYMEPLRFDKDGKPDRDAGSRPVEVDVSFEIERI
jgi:hypothetical protein